MHAPETRGCHPLALRAGIAGLLLTALSIGPAGAEERPAEAAARAPDARSLEAAFADPPAPARPRVWWHWMNGNISKDGIRKDLEWMKRNGIAGFQMFDADIATPQIVDQRLVFMTPAWKDAVRFAASEADRLGLEMAIASSPGFSVTGGPWVQPQDAMKKIAWSEVTLEGDRAFRGKLPLPPQATGPFQDAPPFDITGPLGEARTAAPFYRDARVFAYRLPVSSQPLTFRASVAGRPLDSALLSDGSYDAAQSVPKGSADHPTIIELTLDAPRTVRSITIAARGAFQLFRPGFTLLRVESSPDGSTWRPIGSVLPGPAPTTLSFAPIETRFFRVVLGTVGGQGGYGISGAAPGFDMSVYDAFTSIPDLDLAELRLSGEARVDRWEAKAAFASSGIVAADADLAQEPGVATRDVIDLTGRMTSDGTLDWTPPRGEWRVVRMGWSLLGKTNHPATPEATGLEVDKIDGAAVRRYLETYLALYRDAAGPDLVGARGVEALLMDSTEAGMFNWTPRLLEHFQRLRGYDPRPWLPALTGAIVETRARSDAFLHDFRRTIGELYATEHYGTVARVAHENGLTVYAESLEGSGGGPGDDLDMRRYADVPMGAQWAFGRDEKPQPIHEADMRGAASVAHFYGRNIVAAESLTSIANPWGQAPADLRRTMDLILASGVNRPVIHTSVHVPRDDKVPGLSLWAHGQYFNRLDTWADMARPWIDYIARSSLLLQAGRPVADLAYFYGEEGAIGSLSGGGLPQDLPTRYGYDFVSAKAVRDDLRVDGRDLVAPSGLRYRALYLGQSARRISLPTLRRIAALVDQGATVIGIAPTGSPGLDGDTPEYAALVRRLWPGGDLAAVGRGRVLAASGGENALARLGVAPDFTVAADAGADVKFVHRRIPQGDVYFVTHRGKQAGTLEARFRVTGKAPEIWRADDGTIRPASYRIEQGETVVPLTVRAEDSLFVIFRDDATAPARTVPAERTRVAYEVNGPWSVSFQAGRGAPASAQLARLVSLSEHPDPRIRYFSGIARYTRSIAAPRGWTPGQRALLDLGAIGDVAEVYLNGRLAGTAWEAPYVVDVGRFMRRGRNTLEIRVANLWVNRLIGDAQLGAQRVTYTATPTYTADAPLRPSGLLGPVRLMTELP